MPDAGSSKGFSKVYRRLLFQFFVVPVRGHGMNQVIRPVKVFRDVFKRFLFKQIDNHNFYARSEGFGGRKTFRVPDTADNSVSLLHEHRKESFAYITSCTCEKNLHLAMRVFAHTLGLHF